MVGSTARRGTEAYTGEHCSWLCIEWEPGVFGTQFRQPAATAKLSHRELGLMTQKIPEQLELRTDWPRAGTGKIVKKSLRDEYAAP